MSEVASLMSAPPAGDAPVSPLAHFLSMGRVLRSGVRMCMCLTVDAPFACSGLSGSLRVKRQARCACDLSVGRRCFDVEGCLGGPPHSELELGDRVTPVFVLL